MNLQPRVLIYKESHVYCIVSFVVSASYVCHNFDIRQQLMNIWFS